MTQDEITKMALPYQWNGGKVEGWTFNHYWQLEEFVKNIAAQTLSNIDPSSFMSWQEGYAAGRDAATKGFCAQLRQLHDSYSLASNPSKFRLKDKE